MGTRCKTLGKVDEGMAISETKTLYGPRPERLSYAQSWDGPSYYLPDYVLKATAL